MKKINYIKYSLLCATLLLSSIGISAKVNYDEVFADSTLRLDFIFSGNKAQQHIALDELVLEPHWYGRRINLDSLQVEGNGQITVYSWRTGKILYRNSFSTLFQEWLDYPEANGPERSFENVFLVPFPHDTVNVEVTLRNNRREITCRYTTPVYPKDILIRRAGFRRKTPYKVIWQPKDTTNCIDIAFLAEGYTEKEMGTFLADCDTAMTAIFAHEPFKKYSNRFRIIAVEAPSEDSGTSIPAKNVWKNTTLGSHFDTFYSDRYLTTLHQKRMHDWLNGIPYEHIIVLVNTSEYGGGGIFNLYNLSMTHHRKFKPVVVHEFGHSFAGLADEYAYEQEQIPMYPTDVEPWEPNITTKVNTAAKWADMVNKKQGIGYFEGAGYSLHGVYRPEKDCRMRTNENPNFCHVCQRAIERMIKFYTGE